MIFIDFSRTDYSLQNPSQQSHPSTNEVLPIQIFESYTQTVTNYLPVSERFELSIE